MGTNASYSTPAAGTPAKNPASAVVYKMPAAAWSQGLEEFTQSGAMMAAAVSLENGFDRIEVAGGDSTSCLFLAKQLTLNEYQIRLRVKILGLGDNPVIGFGAAWPAAPYSSYNNGQFSAYLNLLTGAWLSSNYGSAASHNGFLSAAQVDDIIELTLDVEYLRRKRMTAYKAIPYTGEVSQLTRTKNINSDSEGFHYMPGIIMADGSYQVLSYEIISLASESPNIMIAGDSMGAGVRVSHADSIAGELERITGFQSASIAAGSCFLKGMLASVWQIVALRPKYILIANFLDPLLSGSANPGNGSHATWTADLSRYIATIRAAGIKPVFLHPQFWPFLASEAQCQVYAEFLEQTYPDIPRIYVTNSVAVYDGTGFHYAAATNKWIAKEMVSIVKNYGTQQ